MKPMARVVGRVFLTNQLVLFTMRSPQNVSSKSAYDMKNIPNALLLLPVLPVSMTTLLWVLFDFLELGLRV